MSCRSVLLSECATHHEASQFGGEKAVRTNGSEASCPPLKVCRVVEERVVRAVDRDGLGRVDLSRKSKGERRGCAPYRYRSLHRS